jgi:hypothetical protein
MCEEFRVERILSRFRGLRVTYKKGFGLDDWIYCTLYSHISGLQAIQRYRWCTPLQFTVTHAQGLSSLAIPWQRIYDTLTAN